VVQRYINESNIVFRLDQDDYCSFCQVILTSKNSAILSVSANDFDENKAYCKACLSQLIGHINKITAESQGLEEHLCKFCNYAKKKNCKCGVMTIKDKKQYR